MLESSIIAIKILFLVIFRSSLPDCCLFTVIKI